MFHLIIDLPCSAPGFASMGNSFAQGHLYNVHSLDFIKESI